MSTLTDVLHEVFKERSAQDQKWGEQNHPNGTGGPWSRAQADIARKVCDDAADEGRLTWAHVLEEEFFEAMAETDVICLRNELIQVGAVAAAWVEAIDRAEDTDDVEGPSELQSGCGDMTCTECYGFVYDEREDR